MVHSDTVYGPPKMWLTVLDQNRQPVSTVEVMDQLIVLGRGEDCGVVLDDPKVSRHHARLDPGIGPVRVLRDLGSANGTLVNGEPVRPAIGFRPVAEPVVEIRGGEIIQLGDTLVVATLSNPMAGPAAEEQARPNV